MGTTAPVGDPRRGGSMPRGLPVSQVMNRNRLLTHRASCVKRPIGFITWETGSDW